MINAILPAHHGLASEAALHGQTPNALVPPRVSQKKKTRPALGPDGLSKNLTGLLS